MTLFDGGTEVGPLPVTSMTLTIDGNSNVWRQGSFDVGVDLWDTDTRDYLEQATVQQGAVKVEHGILFADESVDWVQIAYLRIDQMDQRLTSATRKFTAYDRAILPQEHLFETPWPLEDTYTNLMQAFLNKTIPGEILTIDPGVNTTRRPNTGKAISEGADRLKEMQQMADVLESWIYNDQYGDFHIGLRDPAGGVPVWTINAGRDGVMVDAEESFSRREQFNAVGITWTPSDNADEDADWTQYIFDWDNDPASSTYYDGPFGKRPKFYDEEYDYIQTTDEAYAIAQLKLKEYLGATRSLSIDAVYNPLLVPGDHIEVIFPDGEVEVHIIDTLQIELGPSARMGIDTRLEREIVTAATVRGSKSGVHAYGSGT